MSQYNESACRTFVAGAAIAQYLRVKLTAGKLAVAGATERELGTMDRASFADGDPVAVRLRTAQGTGKYVAVDAITAGNVCYAAAGGKVSATGSIVVGIALETSANNNDVIEVLRSEHAGLGTVEAHTADDTLTAAESGSTHTTVGATGTVVLTLPPAVPGLNFKFRVGAAQALRIDPDGTETISLPSSGVPQAAGKYITADADGETVAIECTKAGQWSVFGFTGTWTAEA